MTRAGNTVRIALPVWQDRVAPLFDVSRTFLLVDVAGGRVVDRREIEMGVVSEAPVDRVERLVEHGVRVVLCGGISRPALLSLQAAGLQVHPFVAGTAGEVVEAYLDGTLQTGALAMPGCGRRGGRGRRYRGGRTGGAGPPFPHGGPGRGPRFGRGQGWPGGPPFG